MAIQIRGAQLHHRPALSKLLTQNHLSDDDIPDSLPHFWLAFDNDTLIGSAGIEIYSKTGLLRSICVDVNYRNKAIARQLYEVACQAARQQGIQELYLLTTTAAGYFDRLGFVRIDRTTVPNAIQKSTQFSNLCPSSAIVMKLPLS